MKPITVPRIPSAGAILVALAVPIHWLASYHAATARGYPPIDPFWYISPYLPCVLVLFLPLFDDDPQSRRPVRWLYGAVATLGFAAGGFGMPMVVPNHFRLCPVILF